MKKYLLLVTLMFIMIACNNAKDQQPEQEVETVENNDLAMNYEIFGEQIDDSAVITTEQMLAKYQKMSATDTTLVKLKATVKSVCQNKGCWMRLDLGEAESMVKFKDYGFFVPKDIAGREVIVQGKAFIEETSVEDLKHLAEDAGKTKEEIAAITKPEKSFAFISEGVLLVQEK